MRKRKHIHFSEGRLISEAEAESCFKDGWKGIERAYGRELGIQVRKSIVKATCDYLNEARDEQSAPSQSETLKRIKRVSKAANELKSAFRVLDATSRAARELINGELRNLGRSDMIISQSEAARVVIACAHAKEKLKAASGYVQGEAWNRFIRELTKVLKNEGLPTGASHSLDDKSSPFVAFVKALQKGLPGNLRQHRADPSLGKAISRARRGQQRSD